MKSILITLTLFLTFNLQAQETKVTVRAKAKDAKFIGSSLGGALIMIKNANTGELLAKGLTTGSTGNTTLIMKEAHVRNKGITDDATAKFNASLRIDEPTFVTVEALAPANAINAQVHAKTQLWILPGKDMVGEGIILEIPGFVIDLISPQRHAKLSMAEKEEIDIKANIVMMCGCPITKGGTWDSDQITVEAIVKIDGKKAKVVVLKISDTPSTFVGKLKLEKSGNYEIIVTAFNASSQNTGVSKMNFIVGQ